MSTNIYTQINIIPFLALLIIRLNARESLSYSWRNIALRTNMMFLMCVIATSTAARYLDGVPGLLACIGMWLVNLAYFALVGGALFLWYLYVDDIVKNQAGQRRQKISIMMLPLAVFLVVLCATPVFPMIFNVDANNSYVRGPWYPLYVAVAFFYMTATAVMVVRACKNEPTREKRQGYYVLGSFTGLSLASGLLQLFFMGIELLWPLLAASFLVTYLNVQQEQVMRDGLTGLNNRRRFDHYIRELGGQDLSRESWRFLIIDVDRFKAINDTYGHVIGDRVLKMFADQMKRVFGNTRAFMARYGGDEFVIIVNGMSERQTLETVGQLRKGVAAMHWTDTNRWDITLSIGMATYGENGVTNIPEIIALADERMYEEKRVHHEEQARQ